MASTSDRKSTSGASTCIFENPYYADNVSASDAVEAEFGRGWTFTEPANEGYLDAAERSEYEGLINAADFIVILELKVRRFEQIS